MSTIGCDPIFQDPKQVEFYIRVAYTDLASICLFYYDFILTAGDEVKFYSHTKLSLATVLYTVIRYGFLLFITASLAVNIPGSAAFQANMTDGMCTRLNYLTVTVYIVICVAVSAFVALRIMALWSRNWFIGTILFVMGLANPTLIEVSLFYGYTAFASPWPVGGCVFLPDQDESTLYAWEVKYAPIALSAVGITYELLCLSLTLVKTWGNYRLGLATGLKSPLSVLLLRDGSLYFVVLTVLAALDIVAGVPDSKVLLPCDLAIIRMPLR
ncbi:hypothetical protein C8Q76DRAFT_143550 [Earliella scabrosa]|nr:hypothetical protein C8Q76DRAFT_143550 [Earliella scabrosa]